MTSISEDHKKTYSIRSVHNGDGLYLNINIGQKVNEGQIYQWDYPQEWILTQTNSDFEEPIITFKSTISDLYLNADINQKYDGGRICQWDYAQEWKLEIKDVAPDGSLIVTIRSLVSDLYLNADSTETNGGKIHQWDYPQTWKLVRNQDE